MKKLGYRLLFVGSCCEREHIINSLVYFDTKDKAIKVGMKYISEISEFKGFVVLKVFVYEEKCMEIAEKVYCHVR